MLDAEDQEKLTKTLRRGQQVGIVGGSVASHMAHSVAFGDVLLAAQDSEATPALSAAFCVDLGSGAGLPGLLLALRFPTTSWLFTEARGTRVTFLEGALRRLALTDRVEIWPGAVQDAALQSRWRETATLVTARSFGQPAIVAESAAGFLAVGGLLVVSEPEGDATPARWPSDALKELGFGAAEPARAGGHGFVVMRKRTATPPTLPRRRRAMEREPAF